MRNSTGNAQHLAASHFELGSFGRTLGAYGPLDATGHDEGDLLAVVLVEGDVAPFFQVNARHEHLFSRDFVSVEKGDGVVQFGVGPVHGFQH